MPSRDEVEKIYFGHIGFLGLILTDVAVYPTAVPLFNAAVSTASKNSTQFNLNLAVPVSGSHLYYDRIIKSATQDRLFFSDTTDDY